MNFLGFVAQHKALWVKLISNQLSANSVGETLFTKSKYLCNVWWPSGTKVGLPATSLLLIHPSPNSPKITLHLVTKLMTSSCMPVCKYWEFFRWKLEVFVSYKVFLYFMNRPRKLGFKCLLLTWYILQISLLPFWF